MSDDLAIPSSFDGTTRLFPLPNVVFFPKVLLPLHIFEPRYRQMTADALAGDRLITMVLLKEAPPEPSAAGPPLYPIGCLGRIVDEQRLEDGRYHLVLRGVSRVRLVRELPQDKLYRIAHVEPLGDLDLTSLEKASTLRQQLLEGVVPWLSAMGSPPGMLTKLLQNDLPLGDFVDLLSFALPLTFPQKQALLQEWDVEKRAKRLLRDLQTGNAMPKETASEHFPPDFSVN